jgi:uncharacterized protein (DUF1800 family)
MPEAQVKEEILDFDSEQGVDINIRHIFMNGQGQLQANAPQAAGYWGARMALGDKPAQDKLLLFLHDHFAISGEKVNSGVLLVDYLNTMQRMAKRPFAELIEEITLDPAMLLWLDMRFSTDDSPNENFARELLELFTLGVGSYTEEDIQEAARALTGWGLRDRYEGRKQPAETLVHFGEWIDKDEKFIATSFAEDLRDPGPHSVLGTTAKHDVKSISKLTAEHPATAIHMAKKLWEFYAYPNPEPKTVEKLAAVFTNNDGVITETVKAIPEMDEFWSDKAVRSIVKSPVDFLVPVFRQLLNRDLKLDENSEDGRTPQQRLQGVANAVVVLCRRMGMFLLYPPDVAGWKWDSEWITTSTMLDRIAVARILAGQQQNGAAARQLLPYAKAEGLKTDEEYLDALLAILDVPADEEQRALLVELAKKNRLAATPENNQRTSQALLPILQAIFSIPEFHMM